MFWNIFCDICKANGVKPTSVIKQLGFSTGNVGKMKRDDYIPSERMLKEISAYFSISPIFFAGDEMSKDLPVKEELLSSDEKKIIFAYRTLPDNAKSAVQGYISALSHIYNKDNDIVKDIISLTDKLPHKDKEYLHELIKAQLKMIEKNEADGCE